MPAASGRAAPRSSFVRTPHTLTRGRMESANEGLLPRAQRALGILRSHESLADERGIRAGGAHALQVVDALDPALGDLDRPGRNLRQQSFDRREVDMERLQVARVDAEELGLERNRELELALVVHLDQHRESELARDGG